MSASTALVTGGASGIGQEVAARLRDAGHDVVVWDLADADIICDVSDPDAVSTAMEHTVREHGVPTRVVTSAGIGASGQLLKLQASEWERVLQVNLTGTWLTIRAAAQAMVEAKVGGSIVAVSSISGTVADRDMGAYCVSKAGVDMLVKVAAVEWGTHNVRVNAVGPGVTRTPMLPNPEAWPGWVDGLSRRTALGRLGEVSDVAGAIVGVLELPWVTGQVVHADGGLALHSPIDAYGQVERLIRLKRLRELRDQRENANKANKAKKAKKA
ncbi:Dihydroanticapsin 7-dehydrogenase [Mycobacterium attenuatum]|uniref:SDR family NAD(P)-dependent oxidoreductase n=1 Tax=Mycobacterium attenuatum TaxID=2341086 RepID=UPI000F044C5C|nr:SDR family oxidoreductase [Mycobacterium attenuatum]VBA57033.1 Dihydroanticapsin 7-dehydrogenase [Mycobacterium attenuatum]